MQVFKILPYENLKKKSDVELYPADLSVFLLVFLLPLFSAYWICIVLSPLQKDVLY